MQVWAVSFHPRSSFLSHVTWFSLSLPLPLLPLPLIPYSLQSIAFWPFIVHSFSNLPFFQPPLLPHTVSLVTSLALKVSSISVSPHPTCVGVARCRAKSYMLIHAPRVQMHMCHMFVHICVHSTRLCPLVPIFACKQDMPHVCMSITSSLAICYSRVQRLFIVAVDE